MSLTGAMSNALSGLTVASKTAQIVSTNVGNALTPGYAARDVVLAPRAEAFGGGVRVTGVSRTVDESLLGDRRLADSGLAYSSERSAFLQDLERLVGTPDKPASLLGQLTRFESALVTAAAKPEEETRLQAAVIAAKDLAGSINTITREVQVLRTEAETKIEQSVQDLNTYLAQVEQLNAQIVDAANRGHPSASYLDQRDRVLDSIAELVPMRLAQRPNGAVAIFTPTGATLLDPSPADISFTASNLVTAHMTVENGLLPALSINGIEVEATGDNSRIAGGRIAALFEVRDMLAVDAQVQIDAIARDLVERFQDPAIDATRAPGAPGLFTDEGGAFAPADETGLSGRIAVNNAVDPEQGGAFWRLRDGLGAAVPGPIGDAALLQSLSGALNQAEAMASGDLGATGRSTNGHFSTLLSRFGQQRLSLDRDLSFAQTYQEGLVETELRQGVDTDAEMERLLRVEQAYSANARMMQVLEDLLEDLMRI